MRRYTRATGALAIDFALAPDQAFQLEEFRMHLVAPGAMDDLTITLVSGVAAIYNTVLLTQDMTFAENLHWQPPRPFNFSRGDSLRIQWANIADVNYGFEIVWSGM